MDTSSNSPQTRPIVFTLFGATGDLSQKKIFPALLNLLVNNRIPQNSLIVAFSRRAWSDDEFHQFILPSLEGKSSNENIQNFLSRVLYVQGTFDSNDSYSFLKKTLDAIDKEYKIETEKLFHLAVQPEFYGLIAQGMHDAGLTSSQISEILPKILIEKPFGEDLNTAQALEKSLELVLKPEQIFRIDHYLGKAGLWSIIDARKADPNLEAHWNNQFVQALTVRFFEKIGIEGRGEFYNVVGATRDVIQNHVLEMLAMATMEIPQEATSEALMHARAEILTSLKPIDMDTMVESHTVVRGQYEGYIHEQDVPKISQTETYIKIMTEIMNSRWMGVPITLEAGKAMSEKKAEVELLFKDGSHKIFDVENPEGGRAYEVVIEKGILNDKKYFVSLDEVIASWKFVTPIVENLNKVELIKYKDGTNPSL